MCIKIKNVNKHLYLQNGNFAENKKIIIIPTITGLFNTDFCLIMSKQDLLGIRFVHTMYISYTTYIQVSTIASSERRQVKIDQINSANSLDQAVKYFGHNSNFIFLSYFQTSTNSLDDAEVFKPMEIVIDSLKFQIENIFSHKFSGSSSKILWS